MFQSKKKQKGKVLAQYKKLKTEDFYFDHIRRYFNGADKSHALQVISDRTYQDLDLDELFMYADRTVSRVGQQYLFYLMNVIPANKNRSNRLEKLIRFFEQNMNFKEEVVFQLSRLQHNNAYNIASLFQQKHIEKPEWYGAVKIIPWLSLLSIVLVFFFPQIIILLVFLLIINYIIHYSNKKNIEMYSGAIPQLLVLNQVAKSILNTGKLTEQVEEVQKATITMDSIGNRMSFFRFESQMQSEVGALAEFFLEIIKAFFLIEPLILFNVLSHLNARRNQIGALFQFVGELDAAISVASFREDLAYYALPQFTDNSKQLNANGIYHPLLQNFVANSFELNEKSVLLTGSNMSGKTTFIRTIGLNVLTAQTLNTCFARAFFLPTMKIHSAISISDDLMSDKSYYFEEVLTIKNILQESQAGERNLFLLDEMFKGTNTIERVAAGTSVLNYLNTEKNFIFISTHDLELAEFLKDGYNLYHFTEVVENNKILFDYKLKTGNLKTTNAIRILELNDYPQEVIATARRLSSQIMHSKISS